MSQKEKTLRETIEEAYSYQIELAKESDRGAAVLAAAYFEDWLRKAILTRFVEADLTTEKNSEIYRPINGFMAKINVAFLLGLYDREILAGLNTVRKIRNKFAHHAKPIRFCDLSSSLKCNAQGRHSDFS